MTAPADPASPEGRQLDRARAASPWFSAAVASAFVAGAFTLIVAGLVVFALSRVGQFDPLNEPQLDALKQALAEQPENAELTAQLRQFDGDLRAQHFRLERFIQLGVWMLIAGLAAFLAAARTALAFRPILPHPKPPGDAYARWRRTAALARWSVAGVGAAALAVVALAVVQSRPTLYATAGPSGSAAAPESAPAADLGPPASPEEAARQWPTFRGFAGSAACAFADIPDAWDGPTGQGIRWKSPVPLPGESSPIVWGDRVFLTGADKDTREVYCFSAETGEMLWRRKVQAGATPVQAPEMEKESAGYACPTAATDGRRVFALFANGDVGCFDFRGNHAWTVNLGLPDSTYGLASSLTTFGDNLLIQFDQGKATDNKSRLIALDVLTGTETWSQYRPVGGSWSSPIVAETPGGWQIITTATPWVIGYDAVGGVELWRADCLPPDVAPSPACVAGVAYAVNAPGWLAAIRTDGAGDVTETHIAWKADEGLPDIVSPLADGKIVLLVASGGRLTCYSAEGKKLWEQVLDGPFHSSPIKVGGSVYLTSTAGATVIFAAGEEYREIRRNELGEEVNATPAFAPGRVFIRGKQNLYCIGKK